MVAAPIATPVTTPLNEPMVASAVVLLAHVPPPPSVSVTDWPIHTAAGPAMADGSGSMITVLFTGQAVIGAA